MPPDALCVRRSGRLVTALWVLAAVAVWVACIVFVLVLCRMSSDEDLSAEALEARLYPDAAR
jgi:uncharacterized membrane protein